jgi:hypothetical protein
MEGNSPADWYILWFASLFGLFREDDCSAGDADDSNKKKVWVIARQVSRIYTFQNAL